MHIHTILLENLLKVKKFLGKENFFFKKKQLMKKVPKKPQKQWEKWNKMPKNLSNFFINCLTNVVDERGDSF